jgi:hypothetical protein
MVRLPHFLLAAALTTTVSWAAPRPARDTADVGDQGAWSVGVFNPLRVAVSDRVELQAHPLAFFVAPNLDARVALLKPSLSNVDGGAARPPAGLRLTAEVGLSLPTFGLRLLKGYLFPTWGTSANDVGWMLIPRFGLLLSGTIAEHDVWTLRADAALRVPLGQTSAGPLNSFLAPLDILLAAPLNGAGARVGGAYDHAFGERLRLRGELNLYALGDAGHLYASGADLGPIATVSPLIVTAHLGLDVAVFAQSRITVGALWANYDQGKSAVVPSGDGYSDRVRVRSNNLLPTIDYIWAGW